MPSRADARIEHIAALVAAYWASHPDAADQAEGIAWWLPELGGEPTVWIEQALQRLVARGLAVRRLLPDGRAVYACARRPGTASGP